MDSKGEYGKCPQQAALEKMNTINTRGLPRLVYIEQPVTPYYRDEGGASKVLFFGFEVHGEIELLKSLADKHDRIPLDCTLEYEDGTPVPRKNDKGKEVWKIMGGLGEIGPDDYPYASLTSRKGGVRYHILEVSNRNESRKYVMKVKLHTPANHRPMKPLPATLRSIPTYVLSKRTGTQKQERERDAHARITRLRARKEKLQRELQQFNESSMVHVNSRRLMLKSNTITIPTRANYRQSMPPMNSSVSGIPKLASQRIDRENLHNRNNSLDPGFSDDTSCFDYSNRYRSNSESSCTTDTTVGIGRKRVRGGAPKQAQFDIGGVVEDRVENQAWIVRSFNVMREHIKKLEIKMAGMENQIEELKAANSALSAVGLEDYPSDLFAGKNPVALKRGISTSSDLNFDLSATDALLN